MTQNTTLPILVSPKVQLNPLMVALTVCVDLPFSAVGEGKKGEYNERDPSRPLRSYFFIPIKSVCNFKKKKGMKDMEKIKLIDGSVHEITRAEVTNGRLEIDFQGRTAEELQDIFSTPALLTNIELLTENEENFGDVPGWTVYGGVMTLGDTKTVILTKAIDVTEQRLTNAEARSIAANTAAEVAKTMSSETATQVTDLQLAICELYEGMEV